MPGKKDHSPLKKKLSNSLWGKLFELYKQFLEFKDTLGVTVLHKIYEILKKKCKWSFMSVSFFEIRNHNYYSTTNFWRTAHQTADLYKTQNTKCSLILKMQKSFSLKIYTILNKSKFISSFCIYFSLTDTWQFKIVIQEDAWMIHDRQN